MEQVHAPARTINIALSDARKLDDSGGGFKISQGLVAIIVALFTLVGGAIGSMLTSYTTLRQTDANATAQIKQQGDRLKHEMQLQNTKQAHEINLEKQKFVQQTITGVVGKGTEEQQRQALRFYATIGIIEEPYASKILNVPREDLPVASALAELQQRLVFSERSALPPDRQSSLSAIYAQYIEFLEKTVAFPRPARHAVLEAYSPESPPSAVKVSGLQSFYDPAHNAIFMPRGLLDNTPLVLREYTHVALRIAIDRIVDQTEIESGLSDYFPASFLAGTALRDEKTVRLLQGLASGDPKAILEGGPNAIIDKGAIWTAALWKCREQLKPERADKLILDAWRTAHGDRAQADRVVGFGSALVDVSRAAGMTEAEQCYRTELEKRKLPTKRAG